MLKDIAESGIFNQPNMTPLESAKVANLYDTFNYINSKIAIQDISIED